MPDITKFIRKKAQSQWEKKSEKFEELIKGKSKKETRDIEMALLRPKPIKKFTGQKTGRSSFAKRTLLITFPNKIWIERLSKFMRISTYIENNTYDINIITELIKLMEKKRLVFDANKKKFYKINKKGVKIKL